MFGIIVMVFTVLVREADSSAGEHNTDNSQGQVAQIIAKQFGKLPLSFEPNNGQIKGKARFVARSGSGEVLLTENEVTLRLRERGTANELSPTRVLTTPKLSALNRNHSVTPPYDINLKFVGSKAARIQALDELPGTVNYFVGNDPKKWYSSIKTYRRIKYENIYPGIDQVFYGNGEQLEYDFLVSPNANPRAIRFRFTGQKEVCIDQTGDLVLRTINTHEIKIRKPVAYQEVNGSKREIPVSYVLKGGNEISFEVGEYDHSKLLVIDPVIWYSTYFGGSGNDAGFDVAVDNSGSVYITGSTDSAEFSPTAPSNVFVAKLSPDGSQRTYLTILGGTGSDLGFSVAVDNAGAAYITGATDSTDFPIANSFQSSFAGGTQDAFVAKLNPGGSTMVYSTYLGGGSNDSGFGIAVDAAGAAYVAGSTDSAQLSLLGNIDAYVTKISPTGNSRVYFSVLGGSLDDTAFDVAVDAGACAYVVGSTDSTDLTIVNALQPNLAGSQDAFVGKLSATGSIVYSTYFGGSESDAGLAIAVDNSGNAYVTGATDSPEFTSLGGRDVFAAKFNATGNERTYLTILGGSGDDAGFGISVDGAGNAYVTGSTSSSNFTTANSLQSALAGAQDVFVAKLGVVGSSLDYSTYVGVDNNQSGFAIAVDALGNTYVTGVTNSKSFPTLAPLQSVSGGSGDAFILKLGSAAATVSVNTAPGSNVAVQGNGARLTFQTIATGGSTFITSQNAVSLGNLPPGFQLFADTKGFSISTLATVQGSISVCSTDYVNADSLTFGRLRILHYENGIWVNRTTTSDFANRFVCSTVTSLGQFAVVLLGPPTALIDSNSNRAAALNSVTSVRDPFAVIDAHNFSADQRTRLVFFVQSVDLLAAESLSLVTAQARDAQNVVYPLPVESVVKVPNMDWLSEVIVKLPDSLIGKGDVQVSVTVRGIQSQPVTMRIQ